MKLWHFKKDNIMIFSHKNKSICIDYTILMKVRHLFPYLGYISYFDCDSSKYFGGHSFFALNKGSYDKKVQSFNYLSDGTRVTQYKYSQIVTFLKAQMRGAQYD